MQKWFVLWFTWLPCAGKTTLSSNIYEYLSKKWYKVELLDWEEIRAWLSQDLWFDKKSRSRNMERITFLSKLLSRNWVIVVAAFVSPYMQDRQKIRKNVTNFIEVFVNAPLEICKKRDVKWMYKKALKWEIKNFTWISDPYEQPNKPEIELQTDKLSIQESCDKIIRYLQDNKYID